jgi:hypothetical protein
MFNLIKMCFSDLSPLESVWGKTMSARGETAVVKKEENVLNICTDLENQEKK